MLNFVNQRWCCVQALVAAISQCLWHLLTSGCRLLQRICRQLERSRGHRLLRCLLVANEHWHIQLQAHRIWGPETNTVENKDSDSIGKKSIESAFTHSAAGSQRLPPSRDCTVTLTAVRTTRAMACVCNCREDVKVSCRYRCHPVVQRSCSTRVGTRKVGVAVSTTARCRAREPSADPGLT